MKSLILPKEKKEESQQVAYTFNNKKEQQKYAKSFSQEFKINKKRK